MGKTDLRHEEHDVFVVCRPVEPDRTIAELLVKRLAAFRLPRTARRDLAADSRRIGSITLDHDDDPANNTVSEREARLIREAEWMAVICTPRLPLSAECTAQIDLFKELHGSDRILTVLAEGDPSVSFPDTLRRAVRHEFDENGKPVTVVREIEPLAAEARAENVKKRSALLDDAVLRMAAPMFGLNYDDLRQRRREKLVRRLIRISAAAACVFLAASLTLLALSSRIHSQNEVISGQTRELQTQYREAQIKNAESMSVVADTLLKKGKRKEAVSSLLSVMPASSEDSTVPYVSSAVRSLTKALGAYDVHCFIADGSYTADSESDWAALKAPADYKEIPEDAPLFPYSNLDVTYYGTNIQLPDTDWNPRLLSGDFDYSSFDWSFLNAYTTGHPLIYGTPVADGAILVSMDGALYHFLPAYSLLVEYGFNLYQTPPEGTFTDAAFRDDEGALYLKDMYGSIIRYRWKDETDFDTAEYSDDDSFLPSDDGKYRIELDEGRCIRIYEAEGTEPVSTLYGNYYETGSLFPLEGTEFSFLYFPYTGAYLLDRNMEICGKIEQFYGYDSERKMILRKCFNRYEAERLVMLPLLGYDELIAKAREFIGVQHTP